jgi:hypothetical protein
LIDDIAHFGEFLVFWQALCFGEKDAITPLKTVLISFVINLVGALGLVCFLPNMIMAVAVATVVAQWAGLSL